MVYFSLILLKNRFFSCIELLIYPRSFSTDLLAEFPLIRGTPHQKKKKKKTEAIYFWLKFINLILAFSFFQDMK